MSPVTNQNAIFGGVSLAMYIMEMVQLYIIVTAAFATTKRGDFHCLAK